MQERKTHRVLAWFQKRTTRLFSACLFLIVITTVLWAKLLWRSVAAAPRSWPTIALQSVIESGLTQPTTIAHAGDGSGRLFITERFGKVRLFKNGSLLSTPFLDLSSSGLNRVNSAGIEQGMLSIAFPQSYVSSQVFYVSYTTFADPNTGSAGDTIIARYRASANPDIADPSSEQIILRVFQPQDIHNGGELQFGPDGFLYIGMGDGGGIGDSGTGHNPSLGNAQDTSTLLGKILRINVESLAGPVPVPTLSFTPVYTMFFPLVHSYFLYTIPLTNPFISTPGYRPEIWALGFRNPWRFSFDRQTGDFYIADVGQSAREEVDFQPATNTLGLNYGWRCFEGSVTGFYTTTNPDCAVPSKFVFPITEYPHGVQASIGCAVTGGYVYRGSQFPAMQGIYFYGDYCRGTIWGLQRVDASWITSTLYTSTTLRISSFGEDQSGELYLTNYINGAIYRITSE